MNNLTTAYEQPEGLPRTVIRIIWNMVAASCRTTVGYFEVYTVIAVWYWFNLFSEAVLSGMLAASIFWTIMVATRDYDMLYPVGLTQRKEGEHE